MIQPGCGAQPDDVDHRQAASRTIIAPERPARLGAVIMQAAGVGRVRIAGGNAAIGGAGSDRDASLARAAQAPRTRSSRVLARAGHAVESAGAVRPAQDRALDAENVELVSPLSTRASKIVVDFVACLLADAWMPQQVDPEAFQLGEPAGRAMLQNADMAQPPQDPAWSHSRLIGGEKLMGSSSDRQAQR